MNENSKNNQVTIKKRNDKPKSFIKRLERLSAEKNNINFNIKEVFSLANQWGLIQQQ